MKLKQSTVIKHFKLTCRGSNTDCMFSEQFDKQLWNVM